MGVEKGEDLGEWEVRDGDLILVEKKVVQVLFPLYEPISIFGFRDGEETRVLAGRDESFQLAPEYPLPGFYRRPVPQDRNLSPSDLLKYNEIRSLLYGFCAKFKRIRGDILGEVEKIVEEETKTNEGEKEFKELVENSMLNFCGTLFGAIDSSAHCFPPEEREHLERYAHIFYNIASPPEEETEGEDED